MPEPQKPRKPQLDERGRLQSPSIERPTGTEPFSSKLPEIADMVNLPDDALQELLSRYGVTGAWEELRNDAMGYAARMSKHTGLTQGDLRREADRLLGGDPVHGYSRRALLGLARETQRSFILDSFANEPPTQEYIRISEDDEHTCDRCLEYAGIIGTLGQHAADPGLPGPNSCDGGAYCRCTLAILD